MSSEKRIASALALREQYLSTGGTDESAYSTMEELMALLPFPDEMVQFCSEWLKDMKLILEE